MTVHLDLPYLMPDTDRHGNERLYVRKNGHKIRIREMPGSKAFAKAYSAALELLESQETTKSDRMAPLGALGWLAAAYFASSQFKALDPRSQATRRLVIEECLREPLKPGSAYLMRLCPVSRLTAAHIQMLRDRKAGLPGAANNRIKYLSAMFGWAVENRHMNRNPARDAKPVRYASSGFYTWTLEDVEAFESAHPIGSKARLALALLMLTGARRGDVVTFGRQHVKDGWIRFVPKKTSYKRKILSEKPVLPELERILASSPTGDLTFLVTEHGKPFSAAGFGAWFRKRCDEAGLPKCTAHGLRKAGATRAAEGGATDRQLMALFDWTTASQATTYTEAVSRKRLAGDAMKLLGRDQTANAELPHRVPHRKKRHG